MAQGVQCLLFKHEDLSSDSQHPCKSQAQPQHWKVETDPRIGSAASLVKTGKFQVQWATLSQKKWSTTEIP